MFSQFILYTSSQAHEPSLVPAQPNLLNLEIVNYMHRRAYKVYLQGYPDRECLVLFKIFNEIE